MNQPHSNMIASDFNAFQLSFADRAAAIPDRVAIECRGHRLTYAELAARSAALAVRLRAAGVGPGCTVAIALEPSPDMVVAVLGVLRVGGAWLPLDMSYPRDRLAFMLQDSDAAFVIADKAAAWPLPTSSLRVISPAGQGSSAVGPAPLAAAGRDDLAYVIYTSGSTGKPKGVMVTHGGLANLAAAQVSVFAVGAAHRVLQFASPAFDASVFEMTLALYSGATLVLLPDREIRFGPKLGDFLREARITHATLPPSVLAALPEVDLPDLEVLICAGEALPAALVDRFGPGRRMFNAYGPTEATVWATIAEVWPHGGKPLIGRPIPGVDVLVLDERSRPLPPGNEGELAITGAGVARGYIAQPTLTADRFVPDPREPSRRMYLTGDLVRLLPSGDLDFVGRVDDQIKLRGFRIEPGEVAAVLGEHAAIRDVTVMVREIAGEERLTAYVVAPGATAAELREFAATQLPAHMVPVIIIVERLPLTPSGKVDRDALSAPVPRTADPACTEQALAPLESQLAALAGQLLGVGQIGTGDDFFVLGGHSLLAGRLAARVRAELGMELPISRIYATPTVAGMAKFLADGTQAPAPAPPPFIPARQTTTWPLSFPQERVWYLEQLRPGNPAYLASAAIRLRGPLDAKVLGAALTEIVRRNQIFQMSFKAADGIALQELRPVGPVQLPVEDLSDTPADSMTTYAQELIQKKIREPFDLTRPPLARWNLIRLAPDDHWLLHTEHHLIHDGWSFGLFLTQLTAIYDDQITGRTMSPACARPEYGDFATWQRTWISGEALRQYLDHWTKRLAGAPPSLELLADRPRPRTQSFEGAALRIDLPARLCDELRRLSRRCNTTLFDVMMAAFGALLHRYTGARDVVIGSGIANRRLAETENIMGMFVNTLPLRLRLPGGRFSDLARQVSSVVADAADWQDVPLDHLVAALAPPRDPSRNPLFQVMFSFHDSAMPDLDFGGLTGEVIEQHNGSAKTDLNVVVIPRAEQRRGQPGRQEDQRITLIWEYATALFEDDTMQRMAGQYIRLLEAAVAVPDTPVERLDMLSPAEAGQVLSQWNRTASPYPDRSTIRELFEAQAAATPGSAAVLSGPDQLSYGELDARADRLAEVIRAQGVTPDQIVGILMPRGIELIVAILAVLKADAAYMPLDPGNPPRRLARILADASARFVITRRATWRRAARTWPGFRDIVPLCLDSGEPPHLASPRLGTPRAGARDLACVIYTSGSTGQPKGVLIEHRSVVRLVRGTDYINFTARERFAQVADPSFDAFTFELWGALLNGGAVVVIPPEVVLQPGGLAREIRKHRITTMLLTTALFNEVMLTRPDTFAGLTNLLVGGEACDPARFRQLINSPSAPTRLLHAYGPAEATTLATIYPVTGVPSGASSVPIGTPISNTTVYVLDALLQPVPVGVGGELHIGGPGVARGYTGRPERTAERFLDDPFGRPGDRMYRTGDIVRWRQPGVLEFLGRADDQVKIRGFRIEPGEIREVLTSHPAIKQAFVAHQERDGERWLTAYLVADCQNPAQRPAVRQLHAFLAERLPAYLIPRSYIFLDALPINAHGKIDHAALPAEDSEPPGPGSAQPRTATERKVAEIFASVLNRQAVGIYDDFFGLGGHSLLASRLIAKANNAFGVDVPLGRFLVTATVAGLAAAIDDERATAQPAQRIPVATRRRAAGLLDQIGELTDAETQDLLDQLASQPAPKTTRDEVE